MSSAVARGLAFRETMTGWFSLGTTDSEQGAREGRLRQTKLSMRASIVIADVTGFVNDSEHAGSISGVIDFAPIGRNLVADRGDFRLFAPRANGGKRMLYALEFTSGGERLRLSGEKHVRGNGLLRIWPETTTLYTRLERRGPKNRPLVIGAGILRIDTLGMLAMLMTMRGIGPSGFARLSAMARFGQFFGGELWNSYVAARRRAAVT